MSEVQIQGSTKKFSISHIDKTVCPNAAKVITLFTDIDRMLQWNDWLPNIWLEQMSSITWHPSRRTNKGNLFVLVCIRLTSKKICFEQNKRNDTIKQRLNSRRPLLLHRPTSGHPSCRYLDGVFPSSMQIGLTSALYTDIWPFNKVAGKEDWPKWPY